ncbi:hypothetical protein [Bradyrhizobium sp. F1.13.3]|uniref:hypothetical protein n=1 Tax=Bradyrhizobium sp. F1.13.3 TaxID=3156351 RepID=UPI00339AE4AD
MTATPEPPEPAAFDLDAAADQAIAACGRDAREAVKALIVAIEFLEVEADELRAAVSKGYSRGRRKPQRDRKDGTNEG